MRRIKLVVAVATAIVASMAFAGFAFASAEGSCIHMPFSPMAGVTVPPTFLGLMLQLAVATGIVLVVALTLAPRPTVRPPVSAGTTQTAS